jgi:hypothetical protein
VYVTLATPMSAPEAALTEIDDAVYVTVTPFGAFDS